MPRGQPDLSPAPSIRRHSGSWLPTPRRSQSFFPPSGFKFLNDDKQVASRGDWDRADCPKLWRYNLHYFDDLSAVGANERLAEHVALIDRWIEQNPVAKGTGWEPFPVSLRVTNWIKWSIREGRAYPGFCDSLAVQVRWLAKNLEFHLRGNHLLANAKALVFAGLYFSGNEADTWLAKGVKLMLAQLQEQILADGGHFERSPMYHSLVLEDILDLINLFNAYRSEEQACIRTLEPSLRASAAAMLGWLSAMVHPDGDIALFNDAAIGVGPSYASLAGYGASLGVRGNDHRDASSVLLASSGYGRLTAGAWTAIVDVGEVGPDYLPGHAHADTLSFELSFNGRRLISNSGTSTYEIGSVRAFERSTAAHNAVFIDGLDSSEVWHAFRVGRRARPIEAYCAVEGEAIGISCSHDGFAWVVGRPIHRRKILLGSESVRWTDTILGSGRHTVEGRIPFTPGAVLVQDGESTWSVRLPWSEPVRVTVQSGAVEVKVIEGRYSPMFGASESRSVLQWRISCALPCEVSFVLERAGDLAIRRGASTEAVLANEATPQ